MARHEIVDGETVLMVDGGDMFPFENLETWPKAIDFARFVEIASGSLFEVVSQATVGLRQNFLSQDEYKALYVAAETQGKMLSGLRRSLTT